MSSTIQVDTITNAAGTGAPSFPFGQGNISTSYGVNNVGLSSSVGSSVLTVNLTQADGSTNPASGSGTVLISFRNSTLATGGFSQRTVTAALTINTVAVGATFGLVSAQAQYIYVYAIDNAGTVELALAGNRAFDEGTRYSTTAIGAGSTDGQTLYSTSARSNVAVRLIGRLKVNETTAGTYASAATEISLLPIQLNSFPKSEVWVYTNNGAGSTNTAIKRYLTTGVNIGTAITYADSATLGASFTINEAGVYSVSMSLNASAGAAFGVSVNSTQLTTGIGGITAADRRIYSATAAANNTTVACMSLNLNVGDVVRPHTDTQTAGADAAGFHFRITHVSK